MSTFQKAVKARKRLRLALLGPSGSGKTYSALAIASGLGGKVAVVCTERGSASLYADRFDFDVLGLEHFSPRDYIAAIQEAGKAGYGVLVIDSLSHAWTGKGGALEMVDNVAKRQGGGNNFTAWREVTPLHNAMIDAILQAPCHVIATMRTKMEYVIEEDARGKKVPRKVGMAPIQRDGFEYEFDVVADMNHEHDFIVSKTRCDLLDGVIVSRPGAELAATLVGWLESGESVVASAPAKPPKRTLSDFMKTGAEYCGMGIESFEGAVYDAELQDGRVPPGMRDHAQKIEALADIDRHDCKAFRCRVGQLAKEIKAEADADQESVLAN